MSPKKAEREREGSNVRREGKCIDGGRKKASEEKG